ncbi:MAG: DUF1080 domain-containing protein [Chitinophagaceae bacterium]|nr:DUF1080 domain-containing protein [Chitinophagaceae bacterium]
MKKIIFHSILICLFATQCFPQKKQTKVVAGTIVPLVPEKWSFKEGKVEFTEYKGRRVMKLAQQSGQVVLRDLIFKDGTIEYDIEPILPEFAESVYFHRKDEKEQEIVYLRVAKMENPFSNDGIQYAPYFAGVNMWDMYPQYQAPANAKSGEWNHVKLVISGKQLRTIVNGKEVLAVPKLEGNEMEGSIAFEGSAYISNIDIKPGVTENLCPAESVDLTKHEANYIRKWSVTQPVLLPTSAEPVSLLYFPKNEFFTEKIDAETAGLVNLTRRFGGNEKRKVVWLKAVITAKNAIKTNLQLGFSDEIWVYLNNQITYVDKNIFAENMKKYPDGRISVQNGGVILNLKQGQNELLIAVANNFYGWGLIARLESTEGISNMESYTPPATIAIGDISQYTGTYASKNGNMKLVISQMNDDLVAQIGPLEPVRLTYAGNNIFKVDRFNFDFELAFKPAEKKLLLKNSGSESEFFRE